MVSQSLRRTARRMGVGRGLVKIQSLRALTARGAIELVHARRRYLRRILRAQPIPVRGGPVEVHMLLHHERLLEGMWALYSFAYFAGVPCEIYVHSDGSLTNDDAARLATVLPGTHIVSRGEADQVVGRTMAQLALHRSMKFRDSLVFALKLIDPFFFGSQSRFVLLDSDVLFFRRPTELVDGLADDARATTANLYSPDNGVRYCLSPQILRQLLGKECIPFFNPGVVRANRSVLDLARVEQYLERDEFWGSSSRPHYYGELTLWAMQLTSAGAQQLPASYAIAPPLDDSLPTSGHFCGGGYPATWFYSRGLPRLAADFGLDGSADV